MPIHKDCATVLLCLLWGLHVLILCTLKWEHLLEILANHVHLTRIFTELNNLTTLASVRKILVKMLQFTVKP